MKSTIANRQSTIALLFAAILAVACAGQTSDPPPSPTAGRIDEILTQLEKRSEGLKDIQTDVTLAEDDRVNLSKSKKEGRIRFWMTEPNPHFMIHFTHTVFDGILRKNEWFLFDGQWLYEAVERRKSVTKQRIAQPGEKLDLFDLETTPFPLPFGQKKSAILKNFDVTLVAPGADDPADTDHLLLVPKQGSRVFEKFDRIDMYVDRQVHLPKRIVVLKNDGYETVAANFPSLSNESINTGLGAADFKRPSEWEGYTETVEDVVSHD